MVTEVWVEDAELGVNFLHPSGPCKPFKWPTRSDMLTISLTDLLCVIDSPVTRNGRTDALSDEDLKNIDLVYTAYIKNMPQCCIIQFISYIFVISYDFET